MILAWKMKASNPHEHQSLDLLIMLTKLISD